MQITPFSPPLTSAAVAVGDVPDDGVAFEKLMTPPRPAERDRVSHNTVKAPEAEPAADKVETEAVNPDPGSTSAETGLMVPARPDISREISPDSAAADFAATPLRQVVAGAPASTGGTAVGALTQAAITTADGVETASTASTATGTAGNVVSPEGQIRAAGEAMAAGQDTENATIRPPATDKPDGRFHAGAPVQSSSMEAPIAAPDVAKNGSQPATAVATQTGAGSEAPATGDVAESGGLPENAANAIVTAASAAQPKVDRPGRKPEFAVPATGPDATGQAATSTSTADGKTVIDVAPISSTYDINRTPPDAKPAKPADTAPPLLANASTLVTDFRPFVTDQLGMGREGVSASGPIAPNGGATSTAAPTSPSQLSQTIVQIIQRGADTPVEVTLRPEELGKVRFDLMTTNDRLHITLFVERPEAMELIRRHGEQLLNDLRQSGFSHPSLSFGDWSQRHARSGNSPLPDRTTEGGATAYDLPAGATARTVAAGRLDLRL